MVETALQIIAGYPRRFVGIWLSLCAIALLLITGVVGRSHGAAQVDAQSGSGLQGSRLISASTSSALVVLYSSRAVAGGASFQAAARALRDRLLLDPSLHVGTVDDAPLKRGARLPTLGRHSIVFVVTAARGAPTISTWAKELGAVALAQEYSSDVSPLGTGPVSSMRLGGAIRTALDRARAGGSSPITHAGHRIHKGAPPADGVYSQ
ncbi:MAG TPA: hypothetical protein VF221_05125 [Chloroflexota bacterium]